MTGLWRVERKSAVRVGRGECGSWSAPLARTKVRPQHGPVWREQQISVGIAGAGNDKSVGVASAAAGIEDSAEESPELMVGEVNGRSMAKQFFTNFRM